MVEQHPDVASMHQRWFQADRIHCVGNLTMLPPASGQLLAGRSLARVVEDAGVPIPQ
jgi:hypothetical protein